MKLKIILFICLILLSLKEDLAASNNYNMKHGNVLVVCIDSLCADHLGCYGYERDTSTCIDGVARSGILFKNAISQAPWTKPSVASLFTSMYMSVHNVWYSYKDTENFAISCKLSSDIVTLAEILKIHGYETAALGQKFHLRKEFGFKQGFNVLNMRLGKSANITKTAISWLNNKRPDKFFMYIHYDDAHFPYAPPDDFKMYDTYKSNANVTGENCKPIRKGEIKLNEEDVNHIVALYDGEIKSVDKKIETLLSQLDQMGYGDNTLVIIFSDHGDEFMEHGGVGHGHTLYDELIHIPLIMKGPTIPKNIKSDGLVQIIDVAPTILDILDLDPHREMEGKSLIPLIFEAKEVNNYAYSEQKGYNNEDFSRAIRTKKWKLIRNFSKKQNLLFDLEKDPGELVNVKDQYPKIATELESQLFEWLKKVEKKENELQFQGTVKIDEAAKERLKSLGYAN